MKSNHQLIAALAGSSLFRDYQRAFTKSTGLPVALRSTEDWQPAFRGVPGENPFCRMLNRESRTCSDCLRLQAKLYGGKPVAPKMLSCPFGLVECAVPVRVGHEVIGYLATGQTLRRVPDVKRLRRTEALLKSANVQQNLGEYRKAFVKTRVMGGAQLASITRLLEIFSEHLAMKSTLLVIRDANTEPGAVTRAKGFVEDHFMEDITLSDAARAAHTSIYYLCKLLKRNLGVSFTELLSRRRVEQAKQLLANPNARVSEVAYEVGFQSLTHFNRIFRKLAGQSPSEYRSSTFPARAA